MELILEKFLNDEEITAIDAAIKEAESKTAGEIKVLIVQSSTMEGTLPRDFTALVDKRAIDEFYEMGLDHTRDHTGILIMVSLKEKRVAVCGGKAIDEKIENVVWQRYINTILDGIKKCKPGEGIARAVRDAGMLLERHFPVKPSDANEVSDQVVFKP